MKLRVVAVGPKCPAWVDEAVADYARRMPRAHALTVDTVAISTRAERVRRSAEEGQRLLSRTTSRDWLVALDERGKNHTARQLADRFRAWQNTGGDVVFLLGGPDGLDASVLDKANERWSLSAATMPHGLARVVVVEQIYRAWTLVSGHPYHRD
ncbi:MAG: 23S rRNA (pseudouridine(1915)-N(3))-methyltransferase RlmH [Pseudomonadaceae bacterium]|nr:23S rRNA (pseudouridine(1915)-N(3))-methyltransferase RlmH [Pseudomonadaceae bacterium]